MFWLNLKHFQLIWGLLWLNLWLFCLKFSSCLVWTHPDRWIYTSYPPSSFYKFNHWWKRVRILELNDKIYSMKIYTLKFTVTFNRKYISLLLSFCTGQKKLTVSRSMFPQYFTCPTNIFILLADWWTDSHGFPLFFTKCSLSAHWVHHILVFTCYSTALLWFSLQVETGVNVVFQIFILYFYLLHYVDSINILVLNLIIVMYTFLFCCFTSEIDTIKMSP